LNPIVLPLHLIEEVTLMMIIQEELEKDEYKQWIEENDLQDIIDFDKIPAFNYGLTILPVTYRYGQLPEEEEFLFVTVPEPNALALHSGFGQYFRTDFGVTLSDIILTSILSIFSLFHLALPIQSSISMNTSMHNLACFLQFQPACAHPFQFKTKSRIPHSNSPPISFPISIVEF
jgi:hypothetical protein